MITKRIIPCLDVKNGRVVKEISQVLPGDEILVDVTDGTIQAQVQTVRERKA